MSGWRGVLTVIITAVIASALSIWLTVLIVEAKRIAPPENPPPTPPKRGLPLGEAKLLYPGVRVRGSGSSTNGGMQTEEREQSVPAPMNDVVRFYAKRFLTNPSHITKILQKPGPQTYMAASGEGNSAFSVRTRADANGERSVILYAPGGYSGRVSIFATRPKGAKETNVLIIWTK